MATELSELPDAAGHFEVFGGKFVPEALSAALGQLEREFRAAMADPGFLARLAALLADYTGRPSPITEARRFAEHARPSTGSGGPPLILLKREDLNHTGSHKINNVLGQALLAERMGKTRLWPRPAPASTASPPPRPPPCSGSSAWSTWATSTWTARRSTCSECGCWAPKCGRPRRAAAR